VDVTRSTSIQLENSILELLVDNLKRLNENEESDRQGVFHILGVFENILGFDPKLSRVLTTKTTVYSWLLERVQARKHDENRGYSAEIMSILLQNNAENRLEFSKQDGIEIYLTVLSHFRRRDPVDADETEFMENIFDGLCSALGEAENKALFVKAEGPDLMVIFMKERPAVCHLAIKALDYAMSNAKDIPICEAFVECLGLKSLFSALMGKVGKKKAKLSTEDLSHVLGIMASLFSSLGSDTPARIRLLAKFVESNYEKVEKLLEIRGEAANRLRVTENKITSEKKVGPLRMIP
jgi:beta-catenin-like protein 1